MKKFLFLLFLVIIVVGCGAQTKTIVGNTITVAWDAPDLTGIPIAEVAYEIVLQKVSDSSISLIATVVTLEAPIVFSTDSVSFNIGVRVKRTIASTSDVVYSSYLWSNIEGSPLPWYVIYYKVPNKVLKIRIK